MERRSFLKAVAAVAPAAGLQTFLVNQALAETPAPPPQGSLHVVGAGKDRFGHPHSLGFSSILFKVPASETTAACSSWNIPTCCRVGRRFICT